MRKTWLKLGLIPVLALPLTMSISAISNSENTSQAMQKIDQAKNLVNQTSDRNLQDIPLPDIDQDKKEFPSKWNVGSGIQWEDKVFAPFVDFLAPINPPKGSIPPNLAYYANNMHANYFNLGFINMGTKISEEELSDRGGLNWGWAGNSQLSEFAGVDTHIMYDGMKQSMRELRAAGGDFTISFGGASGNPFWMADRATVDNLTQTYLEIIEGYGLSRIDLDIEQEAQDIEANKKNAQAIKRVQELTGVEVILTLPTWTIGLDPAHGEQVLQTYLKAGVDISVVNIMAMYLGPEVDWPGIIEAMDNVKNQIKKHWKKDLGITLTDQEAWHHLGVITSIGYENDFNIPLSVAGWAEVVKYAEQKEVPILSMWAANRDALDGNYGNEEGQQQAHPGGVKNKWEYSNVVRPTFVDENYDGESGQISQPGTFESIKVKDITYNSAKVKWVSDNPADVKTHIYLAKEGDSQYQLLNYVYNRQSYNLKDLEVDTTYYLVLANVNQNGDHHFSKVVKFKTHSLDSDITAPVWGDEPGLVNEDQSFYNRVAVDWKQADDENGIKNYLLELSQNGKVIKSQNLFTNQDFNAKDLVVSTIFTGLARNSHYQITITAFDYNNNESLPLNLEYDSGDYRQFDYNKSQNLFYLSGDIVLFTSQDDDWVAAGIGEKMYQLDHPYQGWAPDGTSVFNHYQTDFKPGTVNQYLTGWMKYHW